MDLNLRDMLIRGYITIKHQPHLNMGCWQAVLRILDLIKLENPSMPFESEPLVLQLVQVVT